MKHRPRPEPALPATIRKRRCAVYTRVSTDERLGQAFNSLDAQREACAAHIARHQAEGWVLVAHRYEDGGYSGGTLERPALQRLLADIAQGGIDLVVVYKIDRLSRSLIDALRLIETFSAHEVGFVSATQPIETASSAGRMMQNMLLSVAQFEREVIGERIRDKVAASKARGMWMGGKVPLGYRVQDRKLVVVPSEAAQLRRVFETFAETRSGVATVQQLRAEGITAKSGRALNKGDVYKLLHNRTFRGEVAHKGNIYPGEHKAIVPLELWDAAHAVLVESPRARANAHRVRPQALLQGLLFGADGRALSPTHTRRRGRLYRYYVAQAVLKGDPPHPKLVRSIPAAEIEGAVIAQVRALLRQPEIVVGTWLAARAEAPGLTEEETRQSLTQLEPLWDELFPAEQARIMRLVVERVDVSTAGADIRLRVDGLANLARDLGQGVQAA